MFERWCLVVGGLLVFMALGRSVLKRLPLSTSIIYLLTGIALGPVAAGWIRVDPVASAKVVEHVTEVAVLVSLYVAGLKLRTVITDARWRPAIRLATVGVAATVGLVAVAANLLLGLSWGAAVLLGAILAPTDPVLASDVQVEGTEDRDKLRFALTGESALNDGTAFPFVMLGLGMLGLHDLGAFGWRWVAVDVLWASAAGFVIGGTMGAGFARLVVYLRKEHQEGTDTDDFLSLGLIALAYGAAIYLKAYGFLAVFAAGLAMRHTEMAITGRERDPGQVLREADQEENDNASHPEAAPAHLAAKSLEFGEQLERILEFGVVVLVGAVLWPHAARDWPALGLIALLFFVLRPLAAVASLFRSHIGRMRKPYVAWFGIRGIGSIYYLAYATTHGLPEELARRLTGITLTAVALSTLLHGVTVTPLVEGYGRRIERRRVAMGGERTGDVPAS